METLEQINKRADELIAHRDNLKKRNELLDQLKIVESEIRKYNQKQEEIIKARVRKKESSSSSKLGNSTLLSAAVFGACF